MDHCCNRLYQDTFDDARAKKEMRDYRSTGVKKSSRPLVSILHQFPLEGKTQLDIGAGIGALIFEAFDRGLTKATYIDIAAGFRKEFLQEAGNRKLTERVDARLGDFMDLHQEVGPADLVTLDKVICCYEDYEDLVRQSVRKARRWYIYSVPRDVWWVRLVHGLGLLINKIRKDKIRSFIHPTETIEALIEEAGFQAVAVQRQREWEVKAFERTSSLPSGQVVEEGGLGRVKDRA